MDGQCRCEPLSVVRLEECAGRSPRACRAGGRLKPHGRHWENKGEGPLLHPLLALCHQCWGPLSCWPNPRVVWHTGHRLARGQSDLGPLLTFILWTSCFAFLSGYGTKGTVCVNPLMGTWHRAALPLSPTVLQHTGLPQAFPQAVI